MTMVKKRTATKKGSASKKGDTRASWKGNLSFGLVSFTVEAFNALDRHQSDVHFHQLHAKCHSRIHYDKVCPIHGKLSNDEIVSGYEYQKGKYIEVDPEELDDLQTESERALTIDAFISPAEVDPLYFDGRMYYLMPAESAAQEAYGILRTAMEREGRYGIGQVVMSGKDQVALIRPVDDLLQMAMLNYSAEIRPTKPFSSRLKNASGSSRQLSLAQSLIREWADDKFDFSEYEDEYRERVKKLIDSKVKGKKIVKPEVDEEQPDTINLMDALKKSLAYSKTKKHAAKPRSHSA